MLKIIPLNNDRHLIAAYTKAAVRTNRWIVYLPESGSGFLDGSRAELEQFLNPNLAAEFNYLAINKPGMSRGKVDREMFERSFRRRTRIQDAVKAIRSIIPPTHRIFIIGYSEGAYLAPQVARRLRNVESVTMVGGGTRGWLEEELSNAKVRERAILRRKIREILAEPVASKKWNGFSYATWNSYREDSTNKALRDLNCKVLAILGARDRVIDFKGALLDLRSHARNKGSVQTEVLKNCGHEFTGHWREVRAKLSAYLEQDL